jgi:hypothetical protein
MRSLLVKLRLVSTAGLAAAALGASVPVALHPGDAITDRQLFAYLSYPARPGDWVRYRVVFADRTAVDKTIGFGSEFVSGKPTLFIETHVRAEAVSGLPPGSAVGIGTEAVLKTFVAGTMFGDLSHPYPVITSVLKVGGFEYEVSPGTNESYSALSGAEYSAIRTGTVRSVNAIDLRVGRQTIHATHVVADFQAAPLPVGGVITALTLEVWQSPEAPLGTVAISSAGSRTVDWRMVAYGRGDYRSLFVRTLDEIRAASRPAIP